jgi:hypothetical protein
MHIDRSNYEIWFTDWLDGNLNSSQIEQLKLFLDNNPDLREELNDLNSLKLVSSDVSFRLKEHLRKSPEDISEDQFDYMCAAYLENDLSDSQKAELQEIIQIYPDRKRTFDLIHKTILPPPGISYRHKNRLLRRTPLQNVIRISAIGLSAAAAVTIIIIIYSAFAGTANLKQINTANYLRPDSTVHKPSQIRAKERTITDSVRVIPEKKTAKLITSYHREKIAVANYDNKNPSPDNLERRKIDNPEITIDKVPVHTLVGLKKDIPGNGLIAASQIADIPDVEDERSQVGKFISKTFREKILKEKKPKDTPLNGYEIAEAGISGLNKIFGWQMALEKRNDGNGQPKSIYFSSEILKFNAPVKKREPLQ